MDWKVLDTGLGSPVQIMAQDKELLEFAALEKKPILHFYEWNCPSVTYGYFLDPKKFFCLDALERKEISLARRPTGGGIIFHLWDFAFSALVPSGHPGYSQNILKNYAYINQAVLGAVREFLDQKNDLELTSEDGALLGQGCEYFCMAKPTKYDVMLNGKKVAGAAQRKTKDGFLHQGSISLLMPCSQTIEAVLLPDFPVLEAMNTFTFPLLGKEASCTEVRRARGNLQSLLEKHLVSRQY
jgi:lipoate-protein ligase A